ncbi:MAG TPA: glycosyltransferase [Terriglobia bacterium]|nr:glycosyltransferase [Terriglobia bacterium]
MQEKVSEQTSELNLLLITHDFPPSAFVGGKRAAGFCRYLPEYGIRPVVLTVQERYLEQRDDSFPAPPGVRIERTPVMTNPVEWYGRWKASSPPARDSSPATAPQPTAQKRQGFFRRHVLALVKAPNDYWVWYVPAVRAAKKLMGKVPFAAVISSGPPWISHLIARRIKEKYGLPWLADFRDPWASLHRDERPPWRHRYDLRLEAKCLKSADLIVCNTERLRQAYARCHPDIPESKWVTLTNGYDDAIPFEAAEKKPGKVLVHLGDLYGTRRIDTFCQAIADLAAGGKIDSSSLKILFIGEMDPGLFASSHQYIKNLIQNGCIEFQPRVSWLRAQEILSSADVLLVFQGAFALQVPAKFYEYLRTGKPVFAVTEPGALTDLLESTQSGIWADAKDPAAIAAKFLEALALPTLSREEVQRRYDAHFHYRFLSAQLAEWIRKLNGAGGLPR